MDALEEIVTVDGLDAVLIGPHDLSCNLGIPEQYFHLKFVSAVDSIIQTAREHGIGAGIHVVYPGGMEQEVRWAQLGANLIVHGIDVSSYRSALRADIDALKAALDGKTDAASMEAINI